MNQKRKGIPSPLGQSRSHESAIRHVTGAAKYVDDLDYSRGELTGMALMSTVAAGRILKLDVSCLLYTSPSPRD